MNGNHRDRRLGRRRFVTRALLLTISAGWFAVGGPGQTADPPAKVDPLALAKIRSTGTFEIVATFSEDMPYGVCVSRKGRIFICFPRRGGPRKSPTVAELKDGRTSAYPSEQVNQYKKENAADGLVSVQAAIVDAKDRLWALDMGYVGSEPPLPNGPKLVCIDLEKNKVIKTILIPPEVALRTTFLNDVRCDLRRGKEGMAFISDASATGPNGIVVVDLASGKSWRRLNDHPSSKAEANFLPIIEGHPIMMRPAGKPPSYSKVGLNGITFGPDGKRFYYCPIMSRRLYSVSADALADPTKTEAEVAATVIDHGEKGMTGGMEGDTEGCVYTANMEQNAVLRRLPDGTSEAVLCDPRMLWPDTLYLATDGYMYLTCNQLHRQPGYNNGKNLQQKPFILIRFRCDGKPILLK